VGTVVDPLGEVGVGAVSIRVTVGAVSVGVAMGAVAVAVRVAVCSGCGGAVVGVSV
jgi:hypothetical protein